MIIENKDDFAKEVGRIEAQQGYRQPLAFGIGIGHADGAGLAGLLDTYYPVPNFKQNYGTAAILANLVGHLSGTASYILEASQLMSLLPFFRPFENDGKAHPNIAALTQLIRISKKVESRQVVACFIDSESDQGAESVADAYLRLHLLSHRLVKPHGIKLDKIFSVLPNVAWTSEGPVRPEQVEGRRHRSMMEGRQLTVHSVDKFPRMLDYVVPSKVRIADGARVRLGAYIGEGTTVMHEGFVNFNAGCDGPNMVEGRISAGVFVGKDTDLGGGCSIMGTLSGGGKEIISIGKKCLIGANAGTGISLGDYCTIEAGLYITATCIVRNGLERGKPVKAIELSGRSGLLFRRNSLSGAIEAIENTKVIELNRQLHTND